MAVVNSTAIFIDIYSYMRIISLDASSTTIGLAVLDAIDGKIKLIHQEYYKPLKSDEIIFVRLLDIKKYLLSKLEEFKPDQLAMEEFVMFMKGKSGAKTIIPLAIFNRTLGLTYYEWSNKLPVMLNVLSIRHRLKLSNTLPAKEEMPELVAKHLGIEFPYYYKINKKTKKQAMMEESEDVADAMAVGISYIFEHIEKRPKLKFKKENK